MIRPLTAIAAAVVASTALCWSVALPAAELPAASKKMLADLKFDPKFLDGMDEEYDVPAEWREAAKKEGPLRISGTWEPEQVDKILAPFKERYPEVKFDFDFGNRETRSVRPLVAFKQGRYIADIVDGVESQYFEYLKADALMPLGDIPNLKKVPAEMRDPQGFAIPHILLYWCASYNKNKVKEAELPKTWDGFLDKAVWGNKRIGIGNRPNLWLLALWSQRGDEWGSDYVRRLFQDVRPQLRKEGMDAMISLVSLGEFDVAIPSAGYRTNQTDEKGAPVGWHCPEPVPTTVQNMIALKNNPRPASTRIYSNWILSKEGQTAQYYATFSASVRDDLQTREFLAYPEQIVGRPRALRELKLMETTWPTVAKTWNKEWQAVR